MAAVEADLERCSHSVWVAKTKKCQITMQYDRATGKQEKAISTTHLLCTVVECIFLSFCNILFTLTVLKN